MFSSGFYRLRLLLGCFFFFMFSPSLLALWDGFKLFLGFLSKSKSGFGGFAMCAFVQLGGRKGREK